MNPGGDGTQEGMRPSLLALLLAAALAGCRRHGSDGGPATGGLVAAFGAFGVITNDPGPGQSDEIHALAIDADSMYVGGYDTGSARRRIEKRRLDDGSLVAAFGSGAGFVTFSSGFAPDDVAAIALDATSLYAVGVSTGSGTNQWCYEKRDRTTGALDPVFGAGTGRITTSLAGGNNQPAGIVLDGASMVVAGWDATQPLGNHQWRVEKRSLATGALDAAFASGGVYTSNPSPWHDRAQAIASDRGSAYIVGFQNYGGVAESWRIEKLDLASGIPDAAFGAIVANPGQYSEARSIVVDANSIVVAGVSAWQWRIEKRSRTTGALDPVFGGRSGVVTSDGYVANAILTDGASLWIVGTQTPGDEAWRIEKRDLVTGFLVESFGDGGVVVSNPSAGSDVLYAAAVDAEFLYLGGTDRQSGFDEEWRIEKRTR